MKKDRIEQDDWMHKRRWLRRWNWKLNLQATDNCGLRWINSTRNSTRKFENSGELYSPIRMNYIHLYKNCYFRPVPVVMLFPVPSHDINTGGRLRERCGRGTTKYTSLRNCLLRVSSNPDSKSSMTPSVNG